MMFFDIEVLAAFLVFLDVYICMSMAPQSSFVFAAQAPLLPIVPSQPQLPLSSTTGATPSDIRHVSLLWKGLPH